MPKFSFAPNPASSYFDVPASDWTDWRWQARKSLKSFADFSGFFSLSDEEIGALQRKSSFAVQTTPYYAQLAGQHPADPIRKIFMPSLQEFSSGLQSMLDPLAENDNRPSSRIIHRYPDRCLFLVTDYCNVYCRYCTRKHFTGKEQVFPKAEEWESALRYLRQTPKIREVILSGGDPLTLSDAKLAHILESLRQIEHIEIIRIGSRMPVVNPFRIGPELLQILKKNKPVYIMTHFNHPRELTAEAAAALESLVDNGTPVFNQMVLLNGVNNHASIVQALSRRLLYLRVKPYYMFQCDPSEGTDHLRTSIEDSLQIQQSLWGRVSGLMMPNYSIDIPGGGGKASLVPNYQIEQQGSRRKFRGFDGIESEYISPPPEKIVLPADWQDYAAEWQELCES